MKYGNTSRTLSLIFHLIIGLAFGALGLYYGIFVTPLYWTVNQMAFTNYQVFAFNFNLELAVLGLSLFLISIYGFVQAVKSILRPSDDELVVKSFVAFIAEGYIGALFALANAAIYFDLLSFGSIPFIVIMGLLLAIILLIAANIPMVHIFDGRDSRPLLSGLSYAAGVFFGISALELLASLVGIWSRGGNVLSFNFQVTSLLGFSCLALAIVAILALVAGFVIAKKKGAKPLTIGGFLASIAIMIVGGIVAGNGIFDLYFKDVGSVHMESKTLTYTGLAYPVCAMVFGAAIIGVGIAFLIATAKDSKKAIPAK